jgi:glutamate formiminotransferase
VLLECVPNFSEGRRSDVLDALSGAVRAAGARLLDLHADADHHRSVLTFAGEPAPVRAAALAAARVAVERIDLSRHRGAHPRMGAVDVVPFVPLEGASMDDATAAAREVGRRLGEELGLPVFLYERAASRPARRNLAEIRRPGFEGLRDLVGRDPAWTPDFGPARVHPTAGCVAVGARPFLVAFNVVLGTPDVAVARRIARRLRERDGGLPGVKALGLRLERLGLAQVSMNLCDPERTGPLAAFQAVEAAARDEGVAVRSSELVGLVPRSALPADPAGSLRLEGFRSDRILEERLAAP